MKDVDGAWSCWKQWACWLVSRCIAAYKESNPTFSCQSNELLSLDARQQKIGSPPVLVPDCPEPLDEHNKYDQQGHKAIGSQGYVQGCKAPLHEPAGMFFRNVTTDFA